METKNSTLYFLQGGGEMGRLIRARDWSKTPLGNPEKWPQSLQTMVSVMLNNPFGMYIAWGKEYTQIYNDGYRPILGATKHPQALGISSRETFSEIWHIIDSMFEGVMKGLPVGFPDFMLVLERYGYPETCYFDFAYSPIRMRNGEVGGVLVTVIETTEKKKAEEALKESNNKLQFAMDATSLATWEIDPATRRFTGDKRLKEWHGLPAESEFDLETGFNVVVKKDREALEKDIENALDFSSGGVLDTQYSIVNPNSQQLRIVRAKGKVSFDGDKTPVKFTGTLQNVTEEIVANSKRAENERNLRLMISQAPVAIAILRGDDYVVEIANTITLEVFDRKENDLLNKPVFEAVPELESQGFRDLLDNVRTTGNRFATEELPIQIRRKGAMETVYMNFSYEALYDEEGMINGIMAIGYDVTSQVLARQKVEESEQGIRALIESVPFPIAVYTGKDMRIAFANQSIKDVWGKGDDVEGKFYTEILPELQGQEIFEQVMGVLTTGVPFHAKNQQVDLSIDGVLQSFYFNYSFTPLLDAEGKVYGVLNTAAEVTELHNAKQKVEASEKRFRDSVQQAPLGIAIFRGPDFVADLANSAYLLLVDKKPDEFLGYSLFSVLPEVKEKVAPLFREVVRTGIPFFGNEFPVPLVRNNKQDTGYFNFVYHPLKEETGEISGIMVVATEVTEIVRAKQFLEESEKHFRNMVMQSPIPMTILRGENYVIESANKVMLEQIWRKSEKSVIGRSLLDVFPELKDQKYPQLLHQVFSKGIIHREKESIAYVQSDDGMKKFYLDFEYAPLMDSEGEVYGIMITVNDITDKVMARQKVEANEEKLNLVINASDLGIWEYDLATGEGKASPHCLEMLGLPGEEALNIEQLTSLRFPEDRAAGKEAVAKAFNTGTLHHEGRVVWKDNSVHWVEAKGKVFYDKDKKPTRLLGTVRDITEERNFQQELLEREEKFRLLADSMPQHIWTSEPDGQINYFNKSIFDFSGLSMKEIMNDGWLQIVHPDDRDDNIKAWTAAIATGQDFIFEHRFRKHDGTFRWQLSRAIPQKDQGGKIKMWVGTSTDIQDQKMFATELEKQVLERTRELNLKNLDLENMNKELESFAYISSHDLQEPLRKIQTFTSQILDNELENLSEKGRNKFLRMQNSANRMQILIQDLLAYSRTNVQEKNFKKVALSGIVEEVKEDLKEEIQQKGVIVETGTTDKVKVIPFQFRQVLFNLITNALKFSSNGARPHIRISSELKEGAVLNHKRLAPEKRYCHIRVTDNGIGFEQQYAEKIFKVFQRLHGKDDYTGTGIGLAIVKKIIENHKGVIWAEGELNKGATFHICIPA